ncbi:efflux RND transporter periplasmic adaptor subunit [Echinicola sediminis]
MKINSIYIICLTALVFACSPSDKEHHIESESTEERDHEGMVELSAEQVQSLALKFEKVPRRTLSALVEANGVLEVPPQNEATITAILGANIASIKVIEGDKVTKGQVLASLSHPDLIRLQMDFQQNYHQLEYLESEFSRQATLYEKEVGSGRDLQKIKAELASLRANVKGLESQLKLLGIPVQKIQEGEIMESVPVKSPIGGYIKKVKVKTGQFVSPQTSMFEVVNIDHIHADLMVFEKDVYKVKEGQKVRFKVQTLPEDEMLAEIYAVGKSFEEQPKAVHIHAEIENKKGLLIPGMYVRGQVITEELPQLAVKEGAMVKEGEKYLLFAAEKEGDHWSFKPVEVVPLIQDGEWSGISFLNAADSTKQYVTNKAYYILAEMKKGEGGHHH